MYKTDSGVELPELVPVYIDRSSDGIRTGVPSLYTVHRATWEFLGWYIGETSDSVIVALNLSSKSGGAFRAGTVIDYPKPFRTTAHYVYC